MTRPSPTRDAIVATLRQHNNAPMRAKELATRTGIALASVEAALAKAIRAGVLTRPAPGQYVVADDLPTPDPGTPDPSVFVERKARAKREKAEEPEPVEPDLLIGAWSSGALTIARGDAEIVLTIEERRKLQTWIEIMDEEAL